MLVLAFVSVEHNYIIDKGIVVTQSGLWACCEQKMTSVWGVLGGGCNCASMESVACRAVLS